MPDGTRIALSLVEALTVPKSSGDCEVVIYLNPGVNALGRYFPPGTINDLLLPWHASPPQISKNTSDKRLEALRKEKAKRNLPELGMPDYDADMGEGTGDHGERDETEGIPTASCDEFSNNVRDAPMELDDSAQPPSLEDSLLPIGPGGVDTNEAYDVMDLASFLEFAINSTHCLEILHKSGHKHREVRANAFHVNLHSGAVRFAHFGNRSESLEKTGGPSQLVLKASGLIPDDNGVIREEPVGDLEGSMFSENFELDDSRKVKEAICYMAPEQTGTGETTHEDHRTDLYALGVLFWTLLVGHGTLPFDGSPVELLHKVVQTSPREVHEVRTDVPPVLSAIIAKLLSKSPDARYNSAIGLKNDLMECQKRLQLSCASTDPPGGAGFGSIDLIPSFELGEHDMFLELTVPGDLFGREKEIQQVRTVIRQFAATASAQVHSAENVALIPTRPQTLLIHSNGSFSSSPIPNTAGMSNPSFAVSNISVGYSNTSVGEGMPLADGYSSGGPGTSSGNTVIGTGNGGIQVDVDEDMDGNASDGSDGSPNRMINSSGRNAMLTDSPQNLTNGFAEPPHPHNLRSLAHKNASTSTHSTTTTVHHNIKQHSHNPSASGSHTFSIGGSTISGPSSGLGMSLRGSRTAQAHAIIICGPAGIGKSSLVQMHQAQWRRQGLWGHAKMVKGQASPFTGLLSCLSTILRQLMMFQNDRYMFVSLLKARLSAQMNNLPLLYHGVPELRDILAASSIHLIEPKVEISSEELGARFQHLVETVYATLADVRLLALFLDDLHYADKSTLDLIALLADSKSRMLILTTCRNDDPVLVNRVRQIFSSRVRTTWIDLQPLDAESLGTLVSMTLQRSKEEIAPLTRVVGRVSMGNPFQARNVLQTVWRQGHIWFDWGTNVWQYNLEAIEQSVHAHQLVSAPTDISFLVTHFKDLSEDAQKYLIWASIFGPTFKTNDVANMMDGELAYEEERDGDGSDSKEGVSSSSAASVVSETAPEIDIIPPMTGYSRPSMRGLQQAVAQGWLIQRARDMCSFTHDKYRQAATHMAGQQPDTVIMKMCLMVATHLKQEPERDVFRITEYVRRCIPLVREDPNREEFVECLVQAAESSAARGAHELALHAYKDARTLLGEGAWHDRHEQSQDLTLKLAELYTSQGNQDSSNQLIVEVLAHARSPEDRAHALRLRGRNRFVQREFESAYADTVLALETLGVKLPSRMSVRDLDDTFDQMKVKLLRIGFDEILHLPRTSKPRIDLIVSLMSDAASNAFWGAPLGMADYIGLMVIDMALSEGISPSTAVGFFWCLGGAAERRQMYRFCSDLGKLGLQISYKFGNTIDKCRCEALYSSMVSGYSPEHIRSVIQRTGESVMLARSAGDRIFEGFALCHGLAHRLFCSEHLSDIHTLGEEAVDNIRVWSVNSDTNALVMSILMTVRALSGETQNRNADTAFDTDKWKEAHFLTKLHESSGNFHLVLNWYNSYKVSGLYSLGYYARAAELGFDVYATRLMFPSHRHVRYGLFFHSLAMVQCLRHGGMPPMQQNRYIQQIELNQQYLRGWVSPSPVNNSAWHALIEAEVASLNESPEAFKLYDNAIKMSVNHDWVMEEAWALYLEGSHFLRIGVEGLGSELQARGIARHRQWGAYGIVNHLSRNILVGTTPLKRNIFSAEAAVQTDESEITEALRPDVPDEPIATTVRTNEDSTSLLTAADLSDILKWSQAIASDINLVSSLQRLTEIATRQSHAQEAVFAMRTDEGDYNVVTNCTPPQPCLIYEQPKSIRRIGDPLKRAVLQHCLNSRSRVYFTDTSLEPRFAHEAGQSIIRSVICIPFSNNRGQTYGALFLGNQYPFTQTSVSIISLLCQQASISIANAMLFRSVQQATKANLQMIQSQQQALEEARSSREDAMKATKIKSNFLASMSHELRTPFSSFYGLLDILGSTPLDSNQKELVQTAKQSCELLLKIIDSILDYSKLEASALKLEPVSFLVEDVVADCVELLLPLAAQKLDLSFDIASDVPLWAVGDYSRIRQVLMNLLGNALKFTEKGSVSTTCTVDQSVPCGENEVVLKWVVQDTGIGMSEADMKNLFQPFSQADNSSTRRFGGTGLGLSISLSLVKLMGGVIDMSSAPGVGSEFWFHIPVRVHQSEETRKSEQHLESLMQKLSEPYPLRILISSPSPTTLSLLSTILSRFNVATVSTPEAAISKLKEMAHQNTELDFVILDHFGQAQLDEISRILDVIPSFSNTKAIHLYTPTPFTIPQVGGLIRKPSISRVPSITDGTIDMALASATGFQSTTRQDQVSSVLNKPTSFGRIVRMNKPPRRARLLQLLADLKDIKTPAGGFTGSQIEQALESMETRQNFLKKANVLIAEDNPVANKLLVKQLQILDMTVFSTCDGAAAVKEWERHPIGFFNFALFDHHMPICDGVEAAKRIRALEVRKRATISLPIIALSADCQESTKELCLSAGMTSFLTKPVRPGDLPNLLKTYGIPRTS